MVEVLTSLEERCETSCLDAIACLNEVVVSLNSPSVGVALCGSCADPCQFTLHSDLDVAILAKDIAVGLAFGGELERGWREATSNTPELNISVLPDSAIPDPYLRASLWLGREDHPVRLKMIDALESVECERAHVLEAICEELAARRALKRKARKPINIRTHPDGLRSIWQLKFLAREGLETRLEHCRDWMSRLFQECGISESDGQPALDFGRDLRIARCFSSRCAPSFARALPKVWRRQSHAAEEEILREIGSGDHPARSAIARVYEARALALGIEMQRLTELLSDCAERKLTVCRHAGDEAVALAWCETSADILAVIAERHGDIPEISMGLAFNRATPASLVLRLAESSDWPHARPLLRRRCCRHASLKKMPKLRATLEQT